MSESDNRLYIARNQNLERQAPVARNLVQQAILDTINPLNAAWIKLETTETLHAPAAYP